MIEFDVPQARRIGYIDTIDDKIRWEMTKRALMESQPDVTSPLVSLRAKDAWQQKKWENRQRVMHYRLRDQDVFTEERKGRSLHMYQFVKRLNTLPRRKFFLNTWHLMGFRGMGCIRGGGDPTYVCAVNNGIMPEWSKLVLDAHGLRKREKERGWRTVLTTLIDGKFITEQEALRLFGYAWGVNGRVYRRQLWETRNHKLWDGEANKEANRQRVRMVFEDA